MNNYILSCTFPHYFLKEYCSVFQFLPINAENNFDMFPCTEHKNILQVHLYKVHLYDITLSFPLLCLRLVCCDLLSGQNRCCFYSPVLIIFSFNTSKGHMQTDPSSWATFLIHTTILYGKSLLSGWHEEKRNLNR